MSTLPEQPDEPIISDTLRQDLKDLYSFTASIPAGFDDSVLREAKSTFTQRRRFHSRVRWAIGGISAAAAIMLVALRLSSPSPDRISEHPVVMAIKPGDVDRDGKVDILDAFVVARRLHAHAPIDKAWDVNGDGAVDQKDVDRIGTMAVDISGGVR